ncbi:ABC transporter ATP-binding protein [Inquilinus ginsengisoli]|nr:ABC transporter ATP-binding protein [Inquilinus ginsengisoli]
MEFAVELRGIAKRFAKVGTVEINAVRDIDLSIGCGEFFTLLGPSGCGKTTTLRLVAGFEQPTAGELRIQGRSMVAVPAHLRPVNTVFQSYALFPHLTVEDNVGFGLAVKRVPRRERAERVREALALVRMDGRAGRKPSELSGGQQQRVALARALVNRPAVLLLDEPFGALDLKLRREMQIELKQMQRRLGITFVFVTHDQEEALTMSDRIAVMHDGRVLQVDGPVGIYERPTSRFSAGFIGEMNFLAATVAEAGPDGVALKAAHTTIRLPRGDHALAPGQAVTLAIRPEALAFADATEDGPAEERVRIEGRVRDAIYIGTDRRYAVDLASGETMHVRQQNSAARHRRAPVVGDAATLFTCAGAVRVLLD